MSDQTAECALYRYFDAAGELLYVGISASTIRRLTEHARYAEWFKRSTSMTVERFQSRDEAAAAERLAIASEHPAFNKTFRVGKIAVQSATENDRAMTSDDLKALRKSAKMTQHQLAEAIGLSLGYIGEMERDEKPIEKRTALAVRFVLANPDHTEPGYDNAR